MDDGIDEKTWDYLVAVIDEMLAVSCAFHDLSDPAGRRQAAERIASEVTYAFDLQRRERPASN